MNRAEICDHVLNVTYNIATKYLHQLPPDLADKPLGYFFSSLTDMQQRELHTNAYITLQSVMGEDELLCYVDKNRCVWELIDILMDQRSIT